MTLGEFATAVGVRPRWVQNAFAVIGLKARYDEPRARRLFVARAIAEATNMPLKLAWAVAEKAVAAWPGSRRYVHDAKDNGVTVVLDLERILGAYAARLSLSRTYYAEKRRGRPYKVKRHGEALARWYGVDLTLLDESLKRTPRERLQRASEAATELNRMRIYK